MPVLKDAGDQVFTCQSRGRRHLLSTSLGAGVLSWLKCLKLMEMLVAQPQPETPVQQFSTLQEATDLSSSSSINRLSRNHMLVSWSINKVWTLLSVSRSPKLPTNYPLTTGGRNLCLSGSPHGTRVTSVLDQSWVFPFYRQAVLDIGA